LALISDGDLSELERKMEQALDGVPGGAKAFLEGFLQSTIFVPTRHQQHPLSDAPVYPNDLFELLALQDKERVIIPAFTQVDMIKDWCGNDLLYRKLQVQTLLERVPDEWWLVLNPGMQVEKEFSPWEIEQLRHGPDGVTEVLDDLEENAEQLEPADVAAVTTGYTGLRKGLREFFEKNQNISKIYLLRSLKDDNDSLLIGIRVKSKDEQVVEELRDKCQRMAKKELIGAEDIKVLAALEDQPELALGIFQEEHLVHERTPGIFKRLGRLLYVLHKRN